MSQPSQDGASRCRPLRWRTEAELDDLRQRLDAQVALWCGQWGVPLARAKVLNAWSEPHVLHAGWRVLAHSGRGEASVWMMEPPDWATQLERWLFGPAPIPFDGAASNDRVSASLAGVAVRALRHSLAVWLGGTAADATGEPARPDAADFRPWSGAVAASITWRAGSRDSTVRLHLSAPAVPVTPPLRPSPRPVQGALVPLPSALSDRPIRVRAMLSDVEIPLSDLMNLAVGDVVLSAHRLADTVPVCPATGDPAPMYQARLVQHLGHMALSLTNAA